MVALRLRTALEHEWLRRSGKDVYDAELPAHRGLSLDIARAPASAHVATLYRWAGTDNVMGRGDSASKSVSTNSDHATQQPLVTGKLAQGMFRYAIAAASLEYCSSFSALL